MPAREDRAVPAVRIPRNDFSPRGALFAGFCLEVSQNIHGMGVIREGNRESEARLKQVAEKLA